jgi:hypothetical protein
LDDFEPVSAVAEAGLAVAEAESLFFVSEPESDVLEPAVLPASFRDSLR